MSAVTVHRVFAELLSRAGASDTDRPAWLAERLGGVTATEIRDLMVKGPTFRRELIALKLGLRKDTFTGNQYTAWGNKREPVIAAWVETRFGIQPESRVFRAADNARFLASPDGVTFDPFSGLLLLAEDKTSGYDIAPGTQKFDEVGYLIQMIWGMRVTGARRCLYVWEQHDKDWQDRGAEHFEPAPLRAEPLYAWIDYNELLAARAEKVALEFLAELDAARAALEAGDGPSYDDELDTLAFNVIKFRSAEGEATRAKETAWAELKVKLSDRASFSQESPLARITWTRGGFVEETREGSITFVDEEAAKASRADVWAALHAAEKRAESAARSLEKRRAEWAAVLEEHTSQVPSKLTTSKTVRESLTVTEVKAPKARK
ncbi:YqaJ viral recombinase family protein [Glaciibacter superstes]|uniref:YqaJ viral recombinase family protein n=1 Tax=Glaciibacter superstes TaxID=501023 RepID=UPI0003B305BD|nr:YqaJ viral recombinase family protein [Glaciibacter superstes]